MQTRVVWLLIQTSVCRFYRVQLLVLFSSSIGTHWALVTFQGRVKSGHVLLCVVAELISHTQGRACVFYTPSH